MSDVVAWGLDLEQSLRRIPHRHPLMPMEPVLQLEDGVRGIEVKCVTYSEGSSSVHFPALASR